MNSFPVRVNVLDSTVLSNAYHGSKMCVNQECKLPPYKTIKHVYAEENHPDKLSYLKRRIEEGHESIIEHFILVVEISNVSRAFLQQLARHRHLSLSVQSTRWALKSIIETNEGIVDYVLPNELHTDPEVLTWLEKGKEILKRCRDEYGNDVAKYIAPECLPTKILVTGNAREWRHIYKIRSKPPAMKEFNVFCDRLYDAVRFYHGDRITSLIFDT